MRIHALLLCLLSVPLSAQQTPPEPAVPDQPAPVPAPGGETAPADAGPVLTPIGDFATVMLPSGWQYLPGKDGQEFLHSLGNPLNPNVVGVAIDREHEIFVVYFYNDEGHVKDDDVAKLDYAAILKDMQVDARESNKQ